MVLASLRQPDLVVLDLSLPDLDGVEVCGRIRAFSDVPILVLSALGSEERKVEALDRGADDYVTKPFGMAELEARLRVLLRTHRPAARRADASSPSARSPATSSTGPRAAGRRPATAHVQGVRPARVPRAPRGQGVHAPDDPARGVGCDLLERGRTTSASTPTGSARSSAAHGAMLVTHAGIGYELSWRLASLTTPTSS